MKNSSKYLPWIIVFMVFIATALSFLDRQVLSVSIIKIKEDFPISDTDYGFINTGFLISYAIMFTLGGILIDRFGSRKGLGFSVGIWSLATALHSIATNVFHFGIFRFFLGLGEGGAFPGAIKAVVEWVPKKKQALANGIAIGGAALGAVVAPPLCVYLMASIGWRGVFLVTGVFGLIWAVVWFLIPKKKEEYVAVLKEKEVKSWSHTFKAVGKILQIKEVWIFILIRFILDPIFYYYMFWIPKYLSDSRGVDLEKIGELFWIPFLALGVSNMLGGYFSDKIYRKTGSLDWARKGIMGVAAILTLSALFVKYVPTEELVILIMVIAFFAHGLWITNYITTISDTFGKTITSTVIGLSGTAGALSSVIVNPLMGKIIENYSYDPMWIYSGLMYPIAFILFLIMMPKIRQLKYLPSI
ncbi:MFS transporter [Aurantibacter crassamenti]|uniref:MFS transporter n=1 Tax=Aurantibacter crassamenti TaxID=1837375 RepID=UPI00193AB2A7|nr:MFS transporter [Aurantibacter crassamenti]MBM1106254.1 MFS transporter [Aurantibacter crassamenti]